MDTKRRTSHPWFQRLAAIAIFALAAPLALAAESGANAPVAKNSTFEQPVRR